MSRSDAARAAAGFTTGADHCINGCQIALAFASFVVWSTSSQCLVVLHAFKASRLVAY